MCVGILRLVQKVGILGNIAPGAGRKQLVLHLGFKGGVGVELGGVRVVGSFIYDHAKSTIFGRKQTPFSYPHLTLVF